MDSLLIKGGVPLNGEVSISGANNAVLPIMAATLLTKEQCVIRRVPALSDVQFMGRILSSLGAAVKIEGDTVTCPWHGSVLSLDDGALIHGPAMMPVAAYEVRVEDGRIAIRANAEQAGALLGAGTG